MNAESWETSHLLFLYGSLLLPTGDVPVDAALSGHAQLGSGYIHARLYDLGDYPGAKPYDSPGKSGRSGRDGKFPAQVPESPPKVQGRLLGLADPAPVLAVLDAFEGFDRQSPFTSEFVRSAAAVILPESGRTVTAQVYFYNFSVEGRTSIPSGDYLAFMQARETRR